LEVRIARNSNSESTGDAPCSGVRTPSRASLLEPLTRTASLLLASQCVTHGTIYGGMYNLPFSFVLNNIPFDFRTTPSSSSPKNG
jgi:hypothetical protein